MLIVKCSATVKCALYHRRYNCNECSELTYALRQYINTADIICAVINRIHTPDFPRLMGRFRFSPERDYVAIGSLLSQTRLSSVTLLYPTQGLNL